MTQQTLNITGDTVSTYQHSNAQSYYYSLDLIVTRTVSVHTGVHVTLDSLMKDTDLKSTIKNLVSNSGRSVPASAAGEDDNNKKQGGVIANGSTKSNP